MYLLELTDRTNFPSRHRILHSTPRLSAQCSHALTNQSERNLICDANRGAARLMWLQSYLLSLSWHRLGSVRGSERKIPRTVFFQQIF